MTTIGLAVPVASLEKVRTESYTDCALCSTSRSDPGRPPDQPCRKGTNMSIARILPAIASRYLARTGGQRNMIGKLHGYAHVWVGRDADANNLENQRRLLTDCKTDCKQVFENVGSGAHWNGPG